MKKLIKNAIFTCLFALCCVFAFFCTNSLSAKVNAIENENQTEENVNQEEEKEGKTYTYIAEGEGESTITLFEDGTCTIVAFDIESQETIETQAMYQIVDNYLILLIDDVEFIFTINEETMTLTPDKVNEPETPNEEQNPPIEDTPNEELPNENENPPLDDEQVEEQINELKDWIIALVVSFLGSSGFMALAKVILNKWFNKAQADLQAKLEKMKQDKEIAEEKANQAIESFNQLKSQVQEILENNIVLCDYIKTKIEVDEQKVAQTTKLLESLLPVIKNEIENEEENQGEDE